MPGFAGLFTWLEERVAALATAEVYEPTMQDKADALLQNVKDRYGVYQEGWPPLADSTVLQRHDLGYPDDEPLLRTGGLRDANTASVSVDGAEVVASVGIPAGDPHGAIARAQEYGTLTDHPIPPRPVLRPAAEASALEVVNALGAVIGARLRG